MAARKNTDKNKIHTLNIAFKHEDWMEIEKSITKHCEDKQVSRQAYFAQIVLKSFEKKAEEPLKEKEKPLSQIERLKQARTKTDVDTIVESIGNNFGYLEKAINERIGSLMRIVIDYDDLKTENQKLKELLGKR